MYTVGRTCTIVSLAVVIIALAAGCELVASALRGESHPPTQGATADGDSGSTDAADQGSAGADGGFDEADTATAGLVADRRAAAAFDSIPSTSIAAVPAAFHIFYGHTSHGSQLITGLDMLAAVSTDYPPASAFHMQEYDGDLGTEGDLAWVDATRSALQAPGNNINLVMWSWCGGVSGNTEAGINAYLTAMDQLAHDYPAVTFVYMTGHLDGTGPGDSLYRGNDQIRAWCAQQSRVLFDFADIESYDPAGNHYPSDSDACEWCATWCASHDCPTCGECAHSHCFNCYQKGRAFWWLLARLAGWEGQ
jgi:hypothetical protein